MKTLTIKDIAKLADVSVATVSRVINNNGRFSEETRKKVLDIIEETGYKTNYMAKSLRTNKSYTIGVIVPDISNYFFFSIVEKVEQIMFEKNFTTIICNTDRNLKKEKAYLELLESKKIDGLIVISGAENFEFPCNEIPYVCIDREPMDKSKTIFISSNHYKGGYMATKELIKRGSKNPCIVYYNDKATYSKNRISGFETALKDENLKISKYSKLKSTPFSIDVDLEKILKGNVDSIFAINDNIAMDVLLSLNENNIKVPDDIQVIGFDDNINDKYMYPSLSTIRQNIDEIAKNSVDALIKLMDCEDKKGQSITIDVELVLRNSTKNL